VGDASGRGSVIGALGVARGVIRGLGLAGRWCCEACGPGGAGCAIGRLSWHAQSLGRRGGVRWGGVRAPRLPPLRPPHGLRRALSPRTTAALESKGNTRRHTQGSR